MVSGRTAGNSVSGVGRTIGTTRVLTFELVVVEEEHGERLKLPDCGRKLLQLPVLKVKVCDLAGAVHRHTIKLNL